jgi:hypothetical protein
MRITLYLLRDGVDLGQIILNKAERVAAHGRSFAVTFGTGFHAVKDADIEPDFGLRVVANSVDPAKLTRAEARGLEKGAKNSASSLPVPNAVFALDLSTNEEWIRRFGGQMEDRTFASSASGADSLQLTRREFNLADLPDKLAKILERFSSTRCEEHFPFLDYFRRLPSKAPQVAQLDIQVANQFQDAVRRKRRRGREFLHGDDLVPETVQRADRGGAEPGQVARRRQYEDLHRDVPRLQPNIPILAPCRPPPPGPHGSGIARSRLPRREIADDSIGRKVSIGGRRRSTEESSRRRLGATVRVACQVRAGGCRFLPPIRTDPR